MDYDTLADQIRRFAQLYENQVPGAELAWMQSLLSRYRDHLPFCSGRQLIPIDQQIMMIRVSLYIQYVLDYNFDCDEISREDAMLLIATLVWLFDKYDQGLDAASDMLRMRRFPVRTQDDLYDFQVTLIEEYLGLVAQNPTDEIAQVFRDLFVDTGVF